jgi:ABC-type dipeptide/oligopeptide/nickel transport system ATPase component
MRRRRWRRRRSSDRHGSRGATAQTILRLVRPDSGAVRFRGEDVSGLSGRELRALRRGVQLIFQDPYESLDPRFRVRTTVEEPLLVPSTLPDRDRRVQEGRPGASAAGGGDVARPHGVLHPGLMGERAAELVLRGGAVETMDAARRRVDAVAVRAGRIAAVGTVEEAGRSATTESRSARLGVPPGKESIDQPSPTIHSSPGCSAA